MTRSRRTVARLLVAALALAPVLAAAPAGAEPPDHVDVPTAVDLDVLPGPETAIGTELTLTATASQDGGPTIDAGEVRFVDGDEQVAIVAVDATGTASTTYTPPTVGVHQLRAEYTGAPPDFAPATSVAVEHTVTGDAPFVPEVRLFVSPEDRAPAGSSVTLSATVEEAFVDPRIHGAVVFRDRGVPIGSAELVWDMDYAYATTDVTLAPGVHELSARYQGNLPEIGPSTSGVTTYSSLPGTCPDQATPGNGALVRLAYQATLGRCPDPAGFAYWTDRLDGGASATTMARGLALSSEGIDVTVDAAYEQILDRPADAGGRAVWAAKLRAGWTTSQLWAALAAAPEFITGGGGTLVDRVFERLVGRPVDEPSRAYWTDRLASGPRSGVLRALVLTPEALGHVVDDLHRTALGRTPTTADQTGLQTTIKVRRGDWRTVVADLLGRPAAFAYAQTYPDPAG